MAHFMERISLVDSLWGASRTVVLQHNDVRIEPYRIIFEDAYEGKHFLAKITIQNCGKNTAFVRVGVPSSFALHLSPVQPRGEHIPPGLMVRRTLKYVFSESAPVQYATIPYFVNDEEITQKVKVVLLASRLSCDLYHVDFGEIDLGPTPSIKSFRLSNTGSKSTKFAVDVGLNSMKLIVNPIKGNIQAHSTMVFSVEAVCMVEGKFDVEIWIKSSKPLRIRVSGEAKLGNLEICNTDKRSKLIIFDFPKTYYGAKSVIRIILKSNSAARSVYCTLAKLNNDLIQIDEAEKINPAYKNFHLNPPEGRIGPKEAIIITATFQPLLKTKEPHLSNEDDHRFVLYNIKKLSFCKDIYVNDYKEGLFSTSKKVENLNQAVDARGMLPLPDLDFTTTRLQNRYETVSMQKMSQHIPDDLFEPETCLTICLHSDVEQPSVITTPNEIIINNMKINESQIRVVHLKNLSAHLPIFLSYKKTPFIEIKPKFVPLEPLQSTSVKVFITPAKIGAVKCNIDFELLFYNQPRHAFKGYVPVGQVSVLMKFTTPAVTTLPRRELKSKLPTNISEVNPIRLSNAEFVKNHPVIHRKQDPCPIDKSTSALVVLTKPKSYTFMALKKKYKDDQQKLPEYEVDTKGDYCRGKLQSVVILNKNNLQLHGICPLSPNQMNNVSIEPRLFHIGTVAAYSKITKSFKVNNRNDIPISITIVPEKQRFFFPDGDDKIINPRQVTEIPFDFFSEFEGLHSLCIRIIVNRNHIYAITMQVQVVARALSLDTDKMSFGSNEPLYGFIDIKNPLNVPLDFYWDLSNSSCIINPRKGSVGAGKDLMCTIQFNENKMIPTLQDISLVTEEITKFRFYVTTKSTKIKLELSTNIVKLGNVPLNTVISRALVIKNDSNIALEFKVPIAMIEEGLKITPRQGQIPRKGIMIFKVTLQAKRTVEVDSNINVIFNQSDYLQFRVTGHVMLPKVVIRPSTLHFQKIPLSSFDVAEFYVHNRGTIPSSISFPSKKLREWKVLQDPADNEPVSGDLLIQPKKSLRLYIRYTPMNITNNWFYLPVIINNCIGDIDEMFSLPSRIKLRAIARTHDCVPSLKLFNVVYKSTIEISKFQCDFVHYPHNPELSFLSDQISILNVSQKPIKFCFKLEDLGSLFEFGVMSKHDFTVEGDTLVFTLEPENEIFLKASYHPATPGKSSCRVPMYVQNDYRQNMHNYFIFSAVYQESQMETDSRIYFGMLPLNVHVQKQVVIKKRYHNAKECKVTLEIEGTEHLAISLEKDMGELKNECLQSDVLRIKFTNSQPDNNLGRILIRCSCGCSCEVQVIGNMENSMMTCYGYLQYIVDTGNLTISKCSSGVPEDDTFSIGVMEEVSAIPYFPNTQFENRIIYLETVTAVEDWVFDFGSFGVTRHIIPDSLRYIAPPTEAELLHGNEYLPVVTYVELLTVLAGNKVTEGFNLRCPVEPNGMVLALRCLYANILTFLLEHGGSAPHINPEFLLDYEEYIIYKKLKEETDGVRTVDDFDSISKQSWLDLLLQTIKVFFLSRIKERASDNLAPITKQEDVIPHYPKSMINLETFYKNTIIINQNYFSTTEGLLLKWLEYHYFINILSLCPTFEHESRHKFDNFNSALKDSIVLATVIMRYCPYLKEDLVNLYWKPTLIEENFHNAAKVLQTLTKVDNCFTIYPEQICRGNEIKKLLFVAYLYDFLPTLEPIETIKCKAVLSKSVQIKIAIRNESDWQREYKAILFGDRTDMFRLKKKNYFIEPLKCVLVELTYEAKFVKPMSCTLLLSGEMKKKRICNSICYKLEGIPDVTYMTSSHSATVQLYSFKYFTVEVQSPYNGPGTFKILYTNVEPTDADSLDIESWESRKEEFQVGKINSTVSYLTFDANGVAQWSFLAIAFTMLTKVLYYYLHNDELGDFAIKITVTTQPSKRFEELQVNVPIDIYNRHCICYTSPNINCIRYMRVKIPRTNFILRTFFYEAYCEIFQYVNVKMDDLFQSTNGHRILSHLFQLHKHKSSELQMLLDILTNPVTFNVQCFGEASENVEVAKTFQIKHVDTSGYDSMLIHVNGQLKDGIMLYLTAKSGYEIRIYKLKFEQKKAYKKIDIQ